MARRIRVLHVIKTLNISGAEHFAIELARALDPNRYDVQVCAFFQEDNPIEEHWYQVMHQAKIQAWYTTQWRGLDNFGSYIQGIQEMERHLRVWTPDIINTHFQLGTLAALYCRSKGLAGKVVRTAQNHTRKEWSPGFYGWLRYVLISGWVYPIACDAEVGVSKAIVAQLQAAAGARFARKRPIVITNGIPNDLMDRAQAHPHSTKEAGHYIVGSIGRLMPQKGYSYLLEAIPLVLGNFPHTEFWVIGDGEQRQALEEQARQLGIADHLRFLGRQEDVFVWLRQMDLFVLPSLWEGFPMVVMESMAASVPVVATNIDGTRDLISDNQNGWLVPPADASALAEKIIAALMHSTERQRVAHSAIASLEAVKLEKIAAQYDQLYLDLLGAK